MREKAIPTMKRELLLCVLLSLVACSATKVVALEDKVQPVVPEHLKSPPLDKELYQRLEKWLLGNPK